MLSLCAEVDWRFVQVRTGITERWRGIERDKTMIICEDNEGRITSPEGRSGPESKVINMNRKQIQKTSTTITTREQLVVAQLDLSVFDLLA